MHINCTSRPSSLKINSVTENHLIYADSLRVARGTTKVLQGLSFSVAKGEVYALLGGNGAGKSTTLQVCLGLIRPQSGTIRINNVDPIADPNIARQNIAYLPENVALYPHLNPIENIRYFLDISGDRRSREAIIHVLDAVGLEADVHRQPLNKYSKGMKQKTAIALALLRDAPVLLLDEPTSGLDPVAAKDLYELVLQLKDKGMSVLMVTHDLLGTTDIADRIGLLAHGKIIEEWEAQPHAERFDIRALHGAISKRAS